MAIRDFEFAPASITIDVGDTVTWRNDGPTAHSATADDGSFDTGVFRRGGSRSHTFNEAGTFRYHCIPHPNMKGTVTVRGASGGGGSGGASGGGGSSGSGSGSGTSDTGSGTSPGGTGSSSTGSSSTSGATGSSSTSGSTLADTGADPVTLAIIGLLMLALGAAVQRRARPPDGRSAGRIGR